MLHHRIRKSGYLGLFCFLMPLCTYALDGLSLSFGLGDASVKAYRAAFDWKWPQEWCEGCRFHIDGYVEGSFASLNGQASSNPESNSSLTAYALTPVFRFKYCQHWWIGRPFMEFAIGLAWLSESEIGDRNLGLHGQFEDRAGFGLLLGQEEQWDVNARFMHFSNGFIGADNHGINVYYLTLRHWYN